MTYSTGQSVQPGDKVLLENGAIDGEVIQLIDTPEAKRELGLQPGDQNCLLVKRAGKRILCLTADALQSPSEMQFLSNRALILRSSFARKSPTKVQKIFLG